MPRESTYALPPRRPLQIFAFDPIERAGSKQQDYPGNGFRRLGDVYTEVDLVL